jgi:hypothetical protein
MTKICRRSVPNRTGTGWQDGKIKRESSLLERGSKWCLHIVFWHPACQSMRCIGGEIANFLLVFNAPSGTLCEVRQMRDRHLPPLASLSTPRSYAPY